MTSGPVTSERVVRRPRFLVADLLDTVRGHDLHAGPDAPDGIGSAGGHVLLGRVPERFHRDPQGLLPRQPGAPSLLQRALGRPAPRAGGHVVLLLPPAPGGVVAE